MATEKLPSTLTVHLTAEQKSRYEMICSFDGLSPSADLRKYVIAEIQKWEDRYQSMQQVFGFNGSESSSSSSGGDHG